MTVETRCIASLRTGLPANFFTGKSMPDDAYCVLCKGVARYALTYVVPGGCCHGDVVTEKGVARYAPTSPRHHVLT
jgi:hypothetical protein